MNPELESAISNSALSQVLSPIDVLNLFKRIPEYDVPLLAMDPKRFKFK